MELVLVAIVALVAGTLGGYALTRGRGGGLNEEQFDRVAERVQAEIAETQSQALQRNSEQFLDLAETRLKTETARGEEQLKARKEEIDKGLDQVGGAITKLKEYVESTDKTRSESIASLSGVTAESRKTMEALGAATGKLTEVLASGQARGQWGERMAEDILRVAGFVEGVQYKKNTQIEDGTGRPDYTFLLPEERVLHMDVKFPLAAYLRYLETDSDAERDTAVRDFIRDTRSRVQEITTRDYIDPGNGTLDYVLLFIPNEQVYGFIHEQGPDVLDDALRQRVVLCSPFTLFAVLAVIRQAVDNFHLSQQTDTILTALGGFNQQWGKYKDATRTVQRRMDSTQKAFEELAGRRTRVLDRQVDRVEQLRLEAGVEADELPDVEDDLVELAGADGGLDGEDIEPKIEGG
jgi:DNA recombination protein RmuC